MPKLKTGESLPSFQAYNQDHELIESSNLKGRPLVIYFYPKDDTPGCTTQACSFRDSFSDFKMLDAQVIGISADSPESHRLFAKQHQLPFTLLSDPSNKIRRLFGVPKSLFGLLPGRVTYLFDREGLLIHSYSSQLQVKQHIKEALSKLKTPLKHNFVFECRHVEDQFCPLCHWRRLLR